MLATLTTTPIEPLSLQEAKEFLRVVGDDENTLIQSLISSARLTIEEYTGRAIGRTEYLWHDYRWPDFALQSSVAGWQRSPAFGRKYPFFFVVLPRCPVVEVEAVEVANETGVHETISPSQYTHSSSSAPALLCFGEAPPAPHLSVPRADAVRVKFTAGAAAATAAVDSRIKLIAGQIVTNAYENRSPVIVGGTPSALPHSMRSLLRSLKVDNPFLNTGTLV